MQYTPAMSAERILLEIAIESVDDARAAVRGGADRLELCSALDLGGLTPTPATVAAVKRAAKIPVVAMIRPRAGGFCYSDAELAVMEAEVEASVSAGADGLVFGVLLADGRIDVPRMRRLIARCAGRPVVCHRAFDFTPDVRRALAELIDLGVARVLTSGQQSSVAVPAGMATVRELHTLAAGRIEILPGGGVRPDNVAEIVRATGGTQVHGSFRTRQVDPSNATATAIRLGAADGRRQSNYGVTDETQVAEARRAIDALSPDARKTQ